MSTPPPSNIRYLFLYRVVDGKRQRIRLTVDDQMTILHEEPCYENGTPLKATEEEASEETASSLSSGDAAHVQVLKSRGYGLHIENGKVFIDNMPSLEKIIANFFIPGAECTFGGCEALRQAYLEERAALPNDGASCDVSVLQQKYRNVILTKFRSNFPTPTVS